MGEREKEEINFNEEILCWCFEHGCGEQLVEILKVQLGRYCWSLVCQFNEVSFYFEGWFINFKHWSALAGHF
jgi:hypothetical protein